MRAYSVELKNSAEYQYLGQINETVLILADDMTTALMNAEEYLSQLRSELEEAKHPDVRNLRLYGIREAFAFVDGSVGRNEDSSEARKKWISDLVERSKRNVTS
jgi:hypothetical protein